MSWLAQAQEIVAGLLVLSGAVFMLIGALGVVRLPDFWARLHAASVTDSAGMILMFLGMAVWSGLSLITVKLVIIGLFLFLTGPTATHATANAAYVSGLRPREAEGLEADTAPAPEGAGVGGEDGGEKERLS